jgi:hypothetical protein
MCADSAESDIFNIAIGADLGGIRGDEQTTLRRCRLATLQHGQIG